MEHEEQSNQNETTPVPEQTQESPETPEAQTESRETPPPPPAPEPAGTSGERSSDERMWGMLCHLSALAGFIGVPLGNIIGPLVVWLIKKEEYPFVDSQGKESLNFQIVVTIAVIITIPIAIITCGFGIILTVAVMLAALIFVIIAAVKANAGEEYTYPWNFPFIK
jgi:uncharacterized Tic20 family protein